MSTESPSRRKATSAITSVIRHMPALLLSAATLACAHTPSGTTTSPSKDTATMSATDTSRPHTLIEYPELTPEELGKRFLKLIDSLKSSEDLTTERIQDVMRLNLTKTPETHSAFFNMHLPDSGWYYNVLYYDNPRSPSRKNASYNFINRPNEQGHHDLAADMAPVCGMDFNAYVTELKEMGFVEREELAEYDSPMPPTNADGTMGERRVFRRPGYFFSRGNISVMIRERSEALLSEHPETESADRKMNHICVESISVGGGD